jgi:hypothetical protein
MKKNSASKQTDDQLRQTTLCEFIDEKDASKENNHNHGDKGIRPTTRTDPSGEGGLA